MLLDDNRIKHWILSNKVMCTTAEDRAEHRAAASLPFKQLSAPGVIECLWLDGTEKKKKKKCYFNPRITCQFSRGSRRGRGRNEYLSVYSIRLHELCAKGALGNQAGLRASSLRKRTSANTMPRMFAEPGQSLHPQLPWAGLSLSYWHKLRLMRD